MGFTERLLLNQLKQLELNEKSGIDESSVHQEEIINAPKTQAMREYLMELRENAPSDTLRKTDSVITQEESEEKVPQESARSHENAQIPVKDIIDWNFCLQCLSGIAIVAGGAMLVVGLLLPVPGLAIAGACLLGAGALGYAASRPASKGDEEEGLSHFDPGAPTHSP
jgi:hypothetical protein